MLTFGQFCNIQLLKKLVLNPKDGKKNLCGKIKNPHKFRLSVTKFYATFLKTRINSKLEFYTEMY